MMMKVCVPKIMTILILVARPAHGQVGITPGEWREDLNSIVDLIERWHPDPYTSVDRNDFEKAAADLFGRIPRMSSPEIVVALSRLVAMVSDAHTYLSFPGETDPWYLSLPVRFGLFDDGLYVTAASPAYPNLIGSRVVGVSGYPIEEVYEHIDPVGYRENEMTDRLKRPLIAANPGVLFGLGLINDPTSVSLSLSTPGRSEMDVTVTSIRREPDPVWKFAYDTTRTALPLYLRENPMGAFFGIRQQFWMHTDPDSGILYAQINRMADSRSETLTEFVLRLAARLDDPTVRRVILDFRWNIGGNSDLAIPLVNLLAGHDRINRKGRLYGIIGPASLSATIVTLAELRKHTEIILAGEPTGARSNLFGENLTFTLPNSKLELSVATLWFQSAGPFEDAPWIAPDLYVPVSSSDLVENRDPVLEMIRAHRPEPDLLTVLLDSLDQNGPTAALRHYSRYREQPINRYVDTFRAGRKTAEAMSESGHRMEALNMFELNRSHYPDRARSYLSLGDWYYEDGACLESRKLYSHGLDILNEDRSLYPGLRRALEDHTLERMESLTCDSP